jgi:anti-sigma regulatory factor (Ser/Thr protein kinase)
VALEEILVNVASYAYEDGKGEITIDYVLIDSPQKMISITISDEGKAFNPLEAEDPDTTLPVEQRKIGGLGIFIVKKTMDVIDYDRKYNKNVLTIKKKL